MIFTILFGITSMFGSIHKKGGNIMAFSDTLNKLIEETGVTQYKLAKLLDVSQSSIARWRTGESIPGTDKIGSLAKSLDVPVDYLLGTGVWEGKEALALSPERKKLIELVASLSDEEIERLDRQIEINKENEATHDGQPLSSTQKLLLDKAQELSDDEIKKIIEFADFVKSQRKQ